MATGHLDLDVTALAVGGDGIAREESGRVVFVAGGLPGDRVRGDIVEERKDFARLAVSEVLVPSADRREAPCAFVAAGCGGCDWQHVTPIAQQRLKAGIVEDALRRAAHIDTVVGLGVELPDTGYRTTVRGASEGGRFAFRRAHSHDLVPVDPCLVVHPLLAELIADGRFPDGASVTLRCGARTGERMVVVAPSAASTAVPDDARVVGVDELRRGKRAWFHEEVAGRSWRVSAQSFFQARPDGAEALLDHARDAIGAALDGGGVLVDLYAGVGLFAGALGDGAHVEVVERGSSSAADAKVNLAHADVTITRVDVAKWRARPADVVIADPPRSGLDKVGVAVVAGTGASRLVLVSCDAAALARDARLLAGHGYSLTSSTLVDLFPQTSHLEVVSRFDR